jgi:Domain of Unknown Function (DUF928)
MLFNLYRQNYLKICLLLFLNLVLLSLPLLAQTQTPKQPNQGKPNPTNTNKPKPGLGLPGRRESGGTRGPNTCIDGDVPILALLLPSTNVGLTTAAYPQFFWYTPKNTAKLAQFSLYQISSASKRPIQVYKITFKPSGESGITSLTLPNNLRLPPLGINQNYQWTVSMICNPQDTSPRSVTTVLGWVRRVAVNQDMASQLQRLNKRDRLNLYSQQGLWLDLISTLAQLRACNPNDTTLSNTWVSLIQEIDLSQGEAIAQQPIQQKCPLLPSIPTSPPK